MRIAKIFAGAVALVCFALVPAYPAQKGNSGNHGPKTTTTATGAPATKGPSAKPATVKVEKPVKAVKPVKTETKVAKTDHVKPAKGDATSVKSKKTGTATTAGGTSTTTGTSTTGTSTTGTTKTTVNFTTTPVGQKLAKNTSLSSKLQTRLEALGYKGTVYQAAYGFKNTGQFVAATNVARNLGVSFDQIKLNMTGFSVKPDGTVLQANMTSTGIKMVDPSLATSPAPTKSLGQSIQTVKAGVDSTAAAQTATTQANTEIQSTSTTSTTSTTTSPTTTSKKSTKKAS